ncbi:MAG: T9SS type A sorting domain-containing protein [Bacteroidia bacterium]|nr:T9SS type A sorting domain-containing protein [Bacteroidia bacterium]
MRTIFLSIVIVMVLAITGTAQQPYVKYTYDASGNRESRIIVMPSQSARLSNPADTTHVDTLTTAKQEMQPVKEILSGGQTVNIYPNPTKGILAVEVTNTGSSTTSTGSVAAVSGLIEIVDLNGKQHYINKNFAGRDEINFSYEAAGVYFLRLEIDGKREEWKIIKQ